MLLPNRALAQAIAEEWACQEERVRPQDMALMSLACTAIDIVQPRRAEVVAEVADFGATTTGEVQLVVFLDLNETGINQLIYSINPNHPIQTKNRSSGNSPSPSSIRMNESEVMS